MTQGKNKKERIGKNKMFRCSFMNYYCVKRLLKEGYSYLDFVECYADFTGKLYMYPIGTTSDNVVFFGNSVCMTFLGYSRRDFSWMWGER